jgi:hypothetical protein
LASLLNGEERKVWNPEKAQGALQRTQTQIGSVRIDPDFWEEGDCNPIPNTTILAFLDIKRNHHGCKSRNPE